MTFFKNIVFVTDSEDELQHSAAVESFTSSEEPQLLNVTVGPSKVKPDVLHSEGDENQCEDLSNVPMRSGNGDFNDVSKCRLAPKILIEETV